MGLLFDVSENRLDEVNIRLEKGEDVNQADKSGNTALHLAAEKGLAEMTTLLIRHGADLNAANACPGWSPLHYAAYEGREFDLNNVEAIQLGLYMPFRSCVGGADIIGWRSIPRSQGQTRRYSRDVGIRMGELQVCHDSGRRHPKESTLNH